MRSKQPGENDRIEARRFELETAQYKIIDTLLMAEQFIEVAMDWNLDEVEIDGEMRSSSDVLRQVKATRQSLESSEKS